MLEFSYVNYFFDNKPQPCSEATWEDFVKRMYAISEIEGFKPPMGDYENRQGLISPAIYKEYGLKRSNENVLGWDLMIMDIDDTDMSLEQIQDHFSAFNYIIYSSPSCTKDKLKLRVIIPLAERAPADKLHDVWYAAQMWCEGIIDEQTKDKARIFYIPARYTNKGSEYRHFFLVNRGIDLNWRGMIAKYPAPPEAKRFGAENPLRNLKRKIFTQNNEIPSLDITDPNCPFVYEKMREDYMLTLPGEHHTAIYRFMVKICYNARKINYPLTIEELADMGKQMDDLDGGFYPYKKMLNNAHDAMKYVGM